MSLEGNARAKVWWAAVGAHGRAFSITSTGRALSRVQAHQAACYKLTCDKVPHDPREVLVWPFGPEDILDRRLLR